MRVPVNLSTEPFHRDRPVVAAAMALGLLLLATLGLQIFLIVSQRGQNSTTRNALERLNSQLTTITREQGRLDGTLRRPENAEVLQRSVFLNTLIERKAISWTKLFADLEKVVPPEVRLIAVRLPQINSENQVLLDMTVGAKEAGPVLEMLKHLENAAQFGPTTVLNTLPPSQTDPLFRYRVSVNYAQQL